MCPDPPRQVEKPQRVEVDPQPAPDVAGPVTRQAEQIVLGSLMLDPSQAEKLPDGFTADSFRDHRHATIYKHLVEVVASGETVDPVVLAARMLDAGDLRRVGGVAYLHSCVAAVPTAASVNSHARIVMEAAAVRALGAAALHLGQAAEIENPDRRAQVVAEVAGRLATWGERPAAVSRRRVDIGPYLDGTFQPPQPAVGGTRDDNARLLYAGCWHTVVSLTGAGKSWFACWHAIAEMRRGNVVVYCHFEEHSPASTLARIRSLAPDLSDDDLRERFVWLDCSTGWTPAEFAAALPAGAGLVTLDGINAACSQHGWPVNEPSAIGSYRQLFVTPSVKTGAAVLSLGHPPKAKDRQGERHGFGSSAWLDEVDGVAFRLEKAKTDPIRRDHRGHSALFSVKDRNGVVEAGGSLNDDRDGGWYYLGAFTVDNSTGATNTTAYLTAPGKEASSATDDGPVLPEKLMAEMSLALQNYGAAVSQNAAEKLVKGHRAADKRAALEFLVNSGHMARAKDGQAFKYSHVRLFVTLKEESA
jgi:hypothetical protein